MEIVSTNVQSAIADNVVSPSRSQSHLLSDQLEYWRTHLDHYEHPVVLFDGNLWPVLLNESFQKLILNKSRISATDETVSSVWKAACQTAADTVSKYRHLTARNEIAEFFQIHHTYFIVLGRLLRASNGELIGAVINLTETGSSTAMDRPVFGNQVAGPLPPIASHGDDYTEEEFQDWIACRHVAREKISLLSPRETQVLAYVADGQPNKKIAAALGVTTKTIEKHRSNAAVKMGASSSAEMVRISTFAGQGIPTPSMHDSTRN